MIKAFKWVGLFILLGLVTPTFMSCEPPPTVVSDPDITGLVVGPYTGNYVVNYEADPTNNFSSQITLVVTRVDKKIIKVDAQGGDSFECTLSGTNSSSSLSNINNTSGVYDSASDIEGYFINGTLYYKVTGIVNGGNFFAEFSVI
jgi:hypothetical protein